MALIMQENHEEKLALCEANPSDCSLKFSSSVRSKSQISSNDTYSCKKGAEISELNLDAPAFSPSKDAPLIVISKQKSEGKDSKKDRKDAQSKESKKENNFSDKSGSDLIETNS
jgi:hypothetical protein